MDHPQEPSLCRSRGGTQFREPARVPERGAAHHQGYWFQPSSSILNQKKSNHEKVLNHSSLSPVFFVLWRFGGYERGCQERHGGPCGEFFQLCDKEHVRPTERNQLRCEREPLEHDPYPGPTDLIGHL